MMKLVATGRHRGYELSRSLKTVVKLMWTVSLRISSLNFVSAPLFHVCLGLKTPTGEEAAKSRSPESGEMGREWSKSSRWEHWEGGKERVAWLCGHGSGGGEKEKSWWERQPWEKAGNHCSNLWKLQRKFFSQLVIIPCLDFLIRSVWWWSPLDRGYQQMHWTAVAGFICVAGKKSSYLLGASWWKQKGSDVGRCRTGQRLQKYSVVGKMHSHFLKNFKNKHYMTYYNDLNSISDRLLYLPITAWEQI